MMLKYLSTSVALVICACMATAASAHTINFETVNLSHHDWPRLDGFYDGGYTAGRVGPNYGVTFQEKAWDVASNLGSNGSIFAYTLTSSSWISARNGFTKQITFRYGAFDDTTLFLYDGLDGTGTLLAQRSLNMNSSNDSGSINWDWATLAFSGQARSVVFQSTAGSFGIDDITFGSGPSGVPEPASWAMMIGGFGLAGTALRRQRAFRVRYAV